MSFIFDEDMYKYVDEEDLNRQFKWGSAIYLPRGYALDEIQRKDEIDLEDSWTRRESGFLDGVASVAGWVSRQRGYYRQYSWGNWATSKHWYHNSQRS